MATRSTPLTPAPVSARPTSPAATSRSTAARSTSTATPSARPTSGPPSAMPSPRGSCGRVRGAFSAGRPVTLGPGQTTTVSASAKLADLHFWSWGYGYLYTVHTTLKVDGNPVDTVDTRTGFRKTDFSCGYLTLNGRPIHLHGYAQRATNEWPALGNAVPAWVVWTC